MGRDVTATRKTPLVDAFLVDVEAVIGAVGVTRSLSYGVC